MSEIIGHRGAAFDAPENTLASFRIAWEQRADAIECDVHLSKDGRIVVIHDDNTNRTAGVNKLVADQTLADLRRLDVGSWRGSSFAGEKIPTLEEVLTAAPGDKRTFIEVKRGPEIVPELKCVFAKIRPERVMVISFSSEVIVAAKKELPAIAACWCVDLTPLDVRSTTSILTRATTIGADGIDVSVSPLITADLVHQAKSAGLEVYVWTVNDPVEAKRLVAAGVSGITTDRPGWLREQMIA